MRHAPFVTVTAALLISAVPAASALTQHHQAKHTSASIRHSVAVRKSTHATPGMTTDRATEIQTALIKQGYLNGAPTGTWDAESIAAMQKLQADNGWQTKYTPDARALNKLGLGSPQPAQIADDGQ